MVKPNTKSVLLFLAVFLAMYFGLRHTFTDFDIYDALRILVNAMALATTFVFLFVDKENSKLRKGILWGYAISGFLSYLIAFVLIYIPNFFHDVLGYIVAILFSRNLMIGFVGLLFLQVYDTKYPIDTLKKWTKNLIIIFILAFSLNYLIQIVEFVIDSFQFVSFSPHLSTLLNIFANFFRNLILVFFPIAVIRYLVFKEQ